MADPIKERDDDAPPFGVVGVYDTPAAIYHACEALRDAGYKHFEAHTPFPVHGLERAMGLPDTRLPMCPPVGELATAIASASWPRGLATR